MASGNASLSIMRAGGRILNHVWVLLLGFAVSIVAAIALMAASEQRLTIPQGLTDRIEARIDAAMPALDVEIGAIRVGLDRRAVPRLWIERVTLRDSGGQGIAQLPRLGLAFDPVSALQGRLAPRILRVPGATLTLRRDRNGRFELAFGGGDRRFEGGFGALLASIDYALGTRPLDRAERVELSSAVITVEDARSARFWRVSDADVTLERTGAGLALALSADIFDGSDTLGGIKGRATLRGPTGGAEAQISLENIRSGDIALQSPALAFLGVLDAAISGSLRFEVSGNGSLRDLAGTLEIAEGSVAPGNDAAPIAFDHARSYFSYDPARSRLEFSEISAEGALGSGLVSGHAYLSEIGDAGYPGALLGQFTLDRIEIDEPELFADPVRVEAGQLDLRVSLDPFSIDIGQISLPDMGGAPGRTLRLSGEAFAGREGWTVALDGNAESLAIDALLGLWPLKVAPNARKWLAENVHEADARDAVAAVRFSPGDKKPRLNLSFGFDDARVRVMKHLPPITDGRGIGSIIDNRLAIAVEEGKLNIPDRGALSLAGSTFVIPDGRIKPSPAEIDVVADGPLAALLSTLDAPPLSLLSKAGRDVDLATGRVAGRATIDLVLRPGNRPEDIDIRADAVLRDLVSDRIVDGRELRARQMDLRLRGDTLSVDGRATLDGVGFDGGWRMAIAGEARGEGRVTGDIDFSERALSRFGVTLPDGLVSGEGTAQIDLAMAPGQPGEMSVHSDLVGLRVAIPAVNWSKAARVRSDLDLSITLGERPQVKTIALDAPGLDAEGRIVLGPGSRFEALDLDRVALGGWLDAAVTVRARGARAAPAISVRGGTIDIRRVKLGQGGGGGGGGAARGPVSLRLDQLRVTDTLALAGFSMDLDEGRTLAGRFTGQVNGGVPVQGTLTGQQRGTAIRIRSNDAGAVLRDAGLFRDVAGGDLQLDLLPGGGRGLYDGTIRVTGPRLRNAPAMAELLSAISVVGLVEQMQGQGILFDEVSADFRLSPDRITLYRSSAVGNSLGLSMDGVFDPRTGIMDMQGVVSPIYVLNRVGSVLTRRGEGLFGVNFTLRGPVRDPEVGVNPLSLLTPGVFREIFRRPPPRRED